MMNSFTRVQYTRRSNHTEDIISPLLLACCLAGGSCSCRIICLHGPWVGARTDAPRTRELRAWTGHKVILSCGAGLDLEAWAAATADPSALAVNFCSKRNTTYGTHIRITARTEEKRELGLGRGDLESGQMPTSSCQINRAIFTLVGRESTHATPCRASSRLCVPNRN
jgi:hypothetical protein